MHRREREFHDATVTIQQDLDADARQFFLKRFAIPTRDRV